MMLRLTVLVARQFILCYLNFMFLEILCSSSRVDFCSSATVFNFRFIRERMFKGIWMIILRLFDRLFGFLR